VLDAAEKAKEFITNAIRGGLSLGRGLGPVDAFYAIEGVVED